jgi:hypothetical protein
MPKTYTSKHTPKYMRHATGQGYCTIDGRRFYLGEYDNDATYIAYQKLVELYEIRGRCLPKFEPEVQPLKFVRVNDIIAQYWKYITANESEGQTDRVIITLTD